MERNIIIENICSACHCGERRAEEYLAAELRNLRELRDASTYGLSPLSASLFYAGLEACSSVLWQLLAARLSPGTVSSKQIKGPSVSVPPAARATCNTPPLRPGVQLTPVGASR